MPEPNSSEFNTSEFGGPPNAGQPTGGTPVITGSYSAIWTAGAIGGGTL